MTNHFRFLGLLLGAAAVLAFAGCNSSSVDFPRDFKPVIVQFNLEKRGADATTATALPLSGVRIPYDPAPVLVEKDIIGVRIEPTKMGSCTVFSLTPEAKRQLFRVSTTHQGSRLVVTTNGVPAGFVDITQVMDTGTVPCYLEISDADLPALVNQINLTTGYIQKALR